MSNHIDFSKLTTKVSEFDYVTAVKDEYGVLYSPDGLRLIDGRDCNSRNFSIKKGTVIICDRAFYFCENLKSIIVPDSVTKIGHEAFSCCIELEKITLSSNSIRTIGNQAFYNCCKLFRITLPDSVERIGNQCFFKTSIKELVLPISLRIINGNPIGRYKEYVEQVLHSSKIKRISLREKKNESELVKIKSHSPYFMVENSNLYSSDKTTLISYQANEDKFVIPDSVIKIGCNAFQCNEKLTSITISSNVNEIDSNFLVGTNIDKVINKSHSFRIEDDILYTKNYETLIACFSKKEIIKIPYSVKIIGEGAFCGNNDAVKIQIPFSVNIIGNYAFHNCSNLEKIGLPNSIKKIGDFAFSNCKRLVEVKMPQYLTHCGKFAFNDCIALKYIELSKCLKSISYRMFWNCYRLGKISFPNPITQIKSESFFHCLNLTSIIIPKSVKSIGIRAFCTCSFLEEVIIQNSVTQIGMEAFRYCERLKALYIPESVKRIGRYAFSDCNMHIGTTRIGRYIHNEYSRINLIATTPGNKEYLKKMLPKYLHDVIEELTYKEFMERSKHSKNSNTVEEYEYGSLEKVKCPRCGEWYYEDDGVCDTCGYPWNE